MFEQSATGIKLTGFYRGKVLEHGPGGQCKIFWPGVNPSEWASNPKQLPYAEQAAPLFAASQEDDGLFFYPEVGSIVWGFFENGDVNYPVYFAAFLGSQANSGKKYGKDIQANGRKSENGSYKTSVLHLGNLQITFDGKQSAIEIKSDMDISTDSKKQDKVVSTISFDKNGITIESNKNITLKSEFISLKPKSSLVINAENNMVVTVGGVDGEGKRIPGNIYVAANKINARVTGGDIVLAGDERVITVD